MSAKKSDNTGSSRELAATLIDAIADSIERVPTQFQYEVNVNAGGGVGMLVRPGGPGSVGAVFSPRGPGSVGAVISASGGHAQANVASRNTINQHLVANLETVREIAAEVRSSSPDPSKLRRLLGSLREHLAPAVVSDLISMVLLSVAGIRGVE